MTDGWSAQELDVWLEMERSGYAMTEDQTLPNDAPEEHPIDDGPDARDEPVPEDPARGPDGGDEAGGEPTPEPGS